jgi:hypothetical protein
MMEGLPNVDEVIDATHSDVVQAAVDAGNAIAELHGLHIAEVLSVCLH